MSAPGTVPHLVFPSGPGGGLAEPLLLLGAGALARDIVEACGVEAFCAVYIDPRFAAQDLFGLPVLRDWAAARAAAAHYVLGFLDLAQRPVAHAAAVAAGLRPAPPLVSARAVVSPLARLAPGCLVGHHAVVGAGAELGRDVLVMHNAVIGHDSAIGDDTVVLPGASIGGHAQIGAGSFLGANSVVAPRLRVGRGVWVAPGGACLRDVPDGCTVIGNPGRIVPRATGPASGVTHPREG